MQSILTVLAILFAAYVGYGALLFFGQRSILYYPTPVVPHPYSEEAIEDGEVTVSVVVVNPGANRAILYFGGNGEAVALTAVDLQGMFPDQTLYLLNYRGYGGSGGEPSEQAIYRDALTLYDRAAARHNSIAVIGRSLGSGVATYLAVEREINALVLVTPLDSVVSLAARYYPLYPVRLLVRDRYESAARASAINAPVLIVIAERDDLIPPVHSHRLADSLTHEPRIVTLPEAGHNTVSLHPDYEKELVAFLREQADRRPVNKNR